MTEVHSTAVVEPGAQLGEGTKIGPFCVVGSKVVLGQRTILHSHVVIAGKTTLGADCVIHPFVSLGGPPQHLRYKGEEVELVIGERNILRENVTMNSGTPFGRGKTEIGNDCFFMTGSHVAHDCVLGNNVVFTNNAVVGGHCEIGNHVIIGGNSAVHQFVRIGNQAFVGGMSGLENDLIPYGSCLGDRARLAGYNLIGLKRRGFTRETIYKMRAAYRTLFGDKGTLDERVGQTADQFGDVPEVMEIVSFIRAGNHRAICQPRERAPKVEMPDAS